MVKFPDFPIVSNSFPHGETAGGWSSSRLGGSGERDGHLAAAAQHAAAWPRERCRVAVGKERWMDADVGLNMLVHMYSMVFN